MLKNLQERDPHESISNRKGSKNAEQCSAQAAINLIHGKWKTRILSRLQHGPVRLGELRRVFPQASKKMLAQQLREMERDGLVIRTDLSEKVLHVEYSLSDSGGVAVLHLISVLRDWSNEYLPFGVSLERQAIPVSAASDSGSDQSSLRRHQV